MPRLARFRGRGLGVWVGAVIVAVCAFALDSANGSVQLNDVFDGSKISVAIAGREINVTWAVSNDGTYVDRIAIFNKYEPCGLLAGTLFASPQPGGWHVLAMPVVSAAASLTVHVFKSSAGVALTAPCAWTNLQAFAHASEDVTLMVHSAAAFPGTDAGGALRWVAPVVGSALCNASAANLGMTIEFWMRCAGECSGQVVLDSSRGCGFRVRVLSGLQHSFGPTDVPELLDVTDAFYSRYAHSFLPDRVGTVQLEVFAPDGTTYDISVEGVVADRQWHHVAVLRDTDGGTRLAVDGVPSPTHTLATGLDWSAVLASDGNGDEEIAFGGPLGDADDPSARFAGFVAEARAWNASLRTSALVAALKAQARFADAVQLLQAGGSGDGDGRGTSTAGLAGAGQPVGLLGAWPLTAAAGLADEGTGSAAGALVRGSSNNNTQQQRFSPVAIGPLVPMPAAGPSSAATKTLAPDALRVTCATQASEIGAGALFLVEPGEGTGQYLVQCPKEVCSRLTVDDAKAQLAMDRGLQRLPLAVPICAAARVTGVVSEANQGFDFTTLQLNFGRGANFSGNGTNDGDDSDEPCVGVRARARVQASERVGTQGE
jgi:hypothetical protein